ncbi:hypothetical protein U9M48_002051, partial [Paspalum notatum var. saurae]
MAPAVQHAPFTYSAPSLRKSSSTLRPPTRASPWPPQYRRGHSTSRGADSRRNGDSQIPRSNVIPLPHLLRRLHNSSAPSPRAPHLALAAARGRVRSGTFGPDDAHNLFDELLQQATLVPARSLNGFLAELARAPPSAAYRDGPALTVAFFNRMSRAARPQVLCPTGQTYGILMDCCSRARRPDLGLAFFGQLLKTVLGVTTITFSNLLRSLCETKGLWTMPELGCIPDVVPYTIILKSFCNEGRSQEADKLLRMMAEKEGVCSPDVVTYNTVIYGFFKEGNNAKACDLFYEMMRRGIPPDVATYASVVDALCKARAMDKAEVVLRQMVDKGVQPDIVIFNTLVYGYSSVGQWKQSVRVFKEMTSLGIPPNVVTCNSLMDSLCNHGKIRDARDVFDSMAMKGPKPDIVSYQILFNGYATKGCLDDMTNLFNRMVGDGIAPDLYSFNVVIKSYANCGMLDRASVIFDVMRQQGVTPDVVTYSTVIAAFCRMGAMGDAMENFYQMNDQGVAPNRSTYHLLKAKELVSEMMNKGISPGIVFFSSIINSLCKVGRVMDKIYLTSLALIDGYCLVGKMKKALRVFDAMVSAGLEPDVVVYGTLVQGYCKTGRIDDGTISAKEKFHELGESGIPVDCYTYNTVLSGLFRNHCSDEAIMLFKKLRAMNVKIDIITLNIMIAGMFKTRRTEEAKDLFASIPANGLGCPKRQTICFLSMENAGCHPDSGLLNGVVRVILEKREIIRAGTYLSRLDEMNFSVEASTTALLVDLFSSNGTYGVIVTTHDAPLEVQNHDQDKKDESWHLMLGCSNDQILMIDLSIIPGFITQCWNSTGPLWDARCCGRCRAGGAPPLGGELAGSSSTRNRTRGYCLVGKMKKVLRLFDAMVPLGLEPNVVVYGALVKGYCKIGRIDDGLRLFREMTGKGIKPSAIMYSTTLNGLFQAGRTVSAKEKFRELVESGIPVSIGTYNTVLSGLFKNNCSDEAIMLFTRLHAVNVKTDIMTLNIMIAGMFKTRRIEEAKDLFASIPANGLVPSIHTYCIMMTNLIKEGLPEEADDMFLSMENAGCDPNSRLLNGVVRALLEKREIVRAGTYLSRLDEKNFAIEASTTKLLVDLFSSNGTCQEYIRFLPAKYHCLGGGSP